MNLDISPNIFWSNVVGYISICCWLVVFTPQIWENYTRKSGEGLSMLFLWIWLLGDVFNIIGVLMQNLLFTMLLLALYYTLADTILILQVYFYRRFPARDPETPECAPLLPKPAPQPVDPLYLHPSYLRIRRKTAVIWGTIFLLCLPIVAFIYLWGIPAHPPAGPLPPDTDLPTISTEVETPMEFRWLPALMGWASAALYCGSRVPQIVKNFKKHSTEGLSFMMFGFSVLGNLTYCLSIFIKSVKPQYLLINLPWLVGSGGTLLFDLTIFVQFYVYKNSEPRDLPEPLDAEVRASGSGSGIDAGKNLDTANRV